MYKKVEANIVEKVVELNNLYHTKKELKATLAKLDEEIGSREEVVVATIGEQGQARYNINGNIYTVETKPQERVTVKYKTVIDKLLELIKIARVIAIIKNLLDENTNKHQYVKVDIDVVQG